MLFLIANTLHSSKQTVQSPGSALGLLPDGGLDGWERERSSVLRFCLLVFSPVTGNKDWKIRLALLYLYRDPVCGRSSSWSPPPSPAHPAPRPSGCSSNAIAATDHAEGPNAMVREVLLTSVLGLGVQPWRVVCAVARARLALDGTSPCVDRR